MSLRVLTKIEVKRFVCVCFDCLKSGVEEMRLVAPASLYTDTV